MHSSKSPEPSIYSKSWVNAPNGIGILGFEVPWPGPPTKEVKISGRPGSPSDFNW